jgi:spermidine synthase
VIYLLVFLSGAAALVYQVVWVRSLTLVFGGSHHAVTAVLAIFMAGLALGGYVIGRLVDRVDRPLRLYGWLELGIAASALAFAGLMAVYPAAYVPLARGKDDAVVYLTVLRMAFATVALIVPTTLMGGTLPVLARFAGRRPEALGRPLSFLYGLNTLGAVVGAVVTGFVLLRLYPVRTALLMAVATNAVVAVLSFVLQARQPAAIGDAGEAPPAPAPSAPAADAGGRLEDEPVPALAGRLVLGGIAVSGFCALGYEVLWTRVLAVAIGASVYGFTIMLAAFLTGIALGSKAYGLLGGGGAGRPGRAARAIVAFGVIQVVIGLTALLVTSALRDVAVNAIRLQALFTGTDVGAFGARAWAGFTLAFVYMAVPALFMGAAFPAAGEVHARRRGEVGRAVGEVLAYNTAGAILGAAVSGFALLHLFGLERSLELLALLNAGIGILVLAASARARWPVVVAGVATAAALVALSLAPAGLRFWDTKYLAIFRSNQPQAFATPAMVREAVENTDVLYYAEGAESIISVIRVKGGELAFLTNGRVEASSHLQAQQVQLTLGHLPALLARDPRRVLVVGLGSGMTAGATSAHPTVERVTLVEIEPRVTGVARTFAPYNHAVLDSPKVRLVINDGRNFLMTTRETFDVITADPIHPWFRGAGYLYTTEYFQLAARRLTPGGVVAQWLPIYELTPDDLRSIVRTFRQHFPHTLLWLTHYDAELIGSNSPLLLDEGELGRRMSVPAVAADLAKVMMGSPADLLSYFVMGTQGMAAFSRAGILNTDDRPHLEFSAPFSIATPAVMEANVRALAAHREPILPYLAPARSPDARAEQRRRSDRELAAGRVADPALALFLGGRRGHPDFQRALAVLDRDHPSYAPGRFLQREYQAALALEPRPLRVVTFPVAHDGGAPGMVEFAAVLVPVSASRAAVMFVDNAARVVYGQRYVDDYQASDSVPRLVAEVMAAVTEAYRKEAEVAATRRTGPPPSARALPRMQAAVRSALDR